MKIKSALAVILSLAAIIPSNATTIGFGFAGTTRKFNDASGVQLSSSSLVLAGTFANTSFSLNTALSLQANVASVTAAGGWNQFGLDTATNLPVDGLVTDLGINALGKLKGSVTDNNTNVPTEADFFNGKAIYIWVFNASTVGVATEMGIFRATTTSKPWLFPLNAGGVGDGLTDLSTTPTVSPVISAIGGFGVGSSSSIPLSLTNSFNISAVPEPTTAVFGLFVGIAGIHSRRRHR